MIQMVISNLKIDPVRRATQYSLLNFSASNNVEATL